MEENTLPMASWRYKIETAMNSVVDDVSSVETALVIQVTFVLVVDVLQDRIKTVGMKKVKDFCSELHGGVLPPIKENPSPPKKIKIYFSVYVSGSNCEVFLRGVFTKPVYTSLHLHFTR